MEVRSAWNPSRAKARRFVSRSPTASKSPPPQWSTMQPIEILLVEDNPGDARLAIEVLKDGKFANHISVVEDGVSALQYLRREGKYRDSARPDLVLLDINLPGKDGREVLG